MREQVSFHVFALIHPFLSGLLSPVLVLTSALIICFVTTAEADGENIFCPLLSLC